MKGHGRLFYTIFIQLFALFFPIPFLCQKVCDDGFPFSSKLGHNAADVQFFGKLTAMQTESGTQWKFYDIYPISLQKKNYIPYFTFIFRDYRFFSCGDHKSC